MEKSDSWKPLECLGKVSRGAGRNRGWGDKEAMRHGGALELRLRKTLDAPGLHYTLFALKNKNTFYRFCCLHRNPEAVF